MQNYFKLETQRLEIIPLDIKHYDFWLNDLKSLENELDVIYKAEKVCGWFKDIAIEQRKKMIDESAIWFTFWFIVRKSDRVVVGLADFKEKPNYKGEVEIGYGLSKEFEKNGYMIETVKRMVEWAKGEPNVKNVIAETDLDGFASHRVLINCGFSKVSENETIWWKN